MNNKIICAVTGRNIWEIGNGLSETYYKNVDIKRAITKEISKFIKDGITDFILNAERCFSLWAAEAIIVLRDIRIEQGRPAPRVHIVIPYEAYGSDFDDDTHDKLYEICEESDAVLTLYRREQDKCHENCKRFIIDNCDFLFTDDENYFAAQYAELHKSRSMSVKHFNVFDVVLQKISLSKTGRLF